MMKLYLVVPCYNEEAVLPTTAHLLKEKMNALIETGHVDKNSRILFVNDGSKDATWKIIKSLYEKNHIFSGVCLSRNKGHQNALLAGISYAVNYADAIITLDADLQDDINAIDKMVEKYYEGFEIVYGVRASRDKDTVFKRTTARLYYKMLKWFGVDIVYDHADYRLMSARAAKSLLEYSEVNIFLRGIVPQIGYKWTTVSYNRAERFAGESKYPLDKMIAFALEGITSLSVKPLTLIARLGGCVCVISVGMLIWSIIQRFLGQTVPGWASIMVSLWFIGGVQLICLGIVGEYIGKIYSETKRRPRFFVETFLHDEK